MIRALLVLPLLAACGTQPASVPAAAPSQTAYLCADGTRIGASYGKEGEQDSATLNIAGETAMLLAEPAASGLRYGWPSDGSSYVWWTKGNAATLYWKDGEQGGAETVLHADCIEQ